MAVERQFIEAAIHWSDNSSKQQFIEAAIHRSGNSSKQQFIEVAIHQSGNSLKHQFIEAAIHPSGNSSKRQFIEAPIHQMAFSSNGLHFQWMSHSYVGSMNWTTHPYSPLFTLPTLSVNEPFDEWGIWWIAALMNSRLTHVDKNRGSGIHQRVLMSSAIL